MSPFKNQHSRHKRQRLVGYHARGTEASQRVFVRYELFCYTYSTSISVLTNSELLVEIKAGC